MLLNVHEATSVSCLRIRSRLTSMEVAPPSPTKHMRPHVAVLRTAATRGSGSPVQSMVASAPSPRVSSMMAFTGSVSRELTTASAPNCFARASRSAAMSTAMTRAPIAAPSMVAERPTGPCPNTARVSRPETSMRLSAP
jgi:hypothetical protein